METLRRYSPVGGYPLLYLVSDGYQNNTPMCAACATQSRLDHEELEWAGEWSATAHAVFEVETCPQCSEDL
jgi:hypothetical protein